MDLQLRNFLGCRCEYCCKDIDKTKWDSEWDKRYHLSHHYKSIKCDSCGKKNWVKVEFDGSGHDFLFKRDISPIESLVRRVKER